jgi:hypothetical protein
MALRYAERAYILSPLDTNIAEALATRASGGDRTGAVTAIGIDDIARRLAGSPLPLHHATGKLLSAQSDASAGDLPSALTAAMSEISPTADDIGWLREQRLRIAWRAVELALIVGDGQAVADRAATELVLDRDAALTWRAADTPRYVIAICAYASPAIAEKCFARLATAVTDSAFAQGGRRFAQGDLEGAAMHWKPMTLKNDKQVEMLAEAMVRAFSASGDHSLVPTAVMRSRPSASRFNGATLAMARAAQDALARGQRDVAEGLAAEVRLAWQSVHTVPWIEEVKRIAP